MHRFPGAFFANVPHVPSHIVGMSSSAPRIFDTGLAARRLRRAERGTPADFLLRRASEDIVERLGAVKREFARIVDVGTPTTALAHALAAAYPRAVVERALASGEPGTAETLAFPRTDYDLVASALSLQGTNDLPGALVQIRRALKPDGLFVGAMIGGRTLHELRTALTEAETRVSGGASPRVAPFADVRDIGGLLQRAGFTLPVADTECVTVRYPSLFALMADLRAMGATNVLEARSRRPTPRAVFLEAARIYAERFSDPDGRVRATFEIVSLAGWAAHASQARPAPRGSATTSLAAALAGGRAREPNGG